MKYQFMENNQKTHKVKMMAKVLKISRSGYYEWRKRPRSLRDQMDEELVKMIKEIQEQVQYRYGSPRVTMALKRCGYKVGENRVARLMRENKLGRRRRKRFRSTTKSDHKLPIAKNLLNREFDVAKPNSVWVSDITYIATSQGWLYLCIIIDLHSRKVVGWSMSKRMNTNLVLMALMMAIMNRKPPEGLIFHSDRGSQYCSKSFSKRLKRYKLLQSMSRKGNCWDNAPAESFFKTLKEELSGYQAFQSRKEARSDIFEYIEVFYNRIRLHSTLGYCTPDEYDRNEGNNAA